MTRTKQQEKQRGIPAAPWKEKERPFPFEDPTPFDRAVIEQRQLGHPVSYLVGIGKRCRHQLPQALVTSVLRVIEGTVLPESSTCWLSCPLLVEAVDRLESEGWLERLEERVREDPELREAVERLHREVVELRRRLIPPDWLSRIENDPAFAHHRAILFGTGLAGITRPDHVKCLHAHLADYLCRGTNPIGRIVADLLAQRSIPVDGTPECWKRCLPVAHRSEPREPDNETASTGGGNSPEDHLKPNNRGTPDAQPTQGGPSEQA